MNANVPIDMKSMSEVEVKLNCSYLPFYNKRHLTRASPPIYYFSALICNLDQLDTQTWAWRGRLFQERSENQNDNIYTYLHSTQRNCFFPRNNAFLVFLFLAQLGVEG